MMTPAEIAKLIKDSSPVSVEEKKGIAIVALRFTELAIADAWRSLEAVPPDYLEAVTIRPLAGPPLPNKGLPDPTIEFSITLEPKLVDRTLLLFLGVSLVGGDHATGLSEFDYILVADMESRAGFQTHSVCFHPWTMSAVPDANVEPVMPDPTAFCRDFSERKLVPKDIRPWLLKAAPECSSDAFEQWKVLATPRLMAVISDQVTWGDKAPVYIFSGPPARKVARPLADYQPLFSRLSDSALWIFMARRDADTRHFLLASEWARTYREESLSGFGIGAIESAQTSFNAYVKSGSKETLKALADLRKTIFDEAQKTSQRAQELAGSLWKDVALSATPFVLKLIPDASKVEGHIIGGLMALAASAYLLFSFVTQTKVNSGFFALQEEARDIWRARINAELNAQDIVEFSDEPIKKSLAQYEDIRKSVAVVYIILFMILLIFGITELKKA